jgi:hypothetical protein
MPGNGISLSNGSTLTQTGTTDPPPALCSTRQGQRSGQDALRPDATLDAGRSACGQLPSRGPSCTSQQARKLGGRRFTRRRCVWPKASNTCLHPKGLCKAHLIGPSFNTLFTTFGQNN